MHPIGIRRRCTDRCGVVYESPFSGALQGLDVVRAGADARPHRTPQRFDERNPMRLTRTPIRRCHTRQARPAPSLAIKGIP
jgi:hypothetical protein